MAQEGDIVFTIGADVAGLTRGGQAGEKALADLEREAKTLERQLGKIGQAGVDFQRQMNALTGVNREVAKSARDSAAAFDAFEKSRAQVDNLRASIDPLFAASKRYEQALGQLDTALERGAISAREHAAMTDQLAAAYLRADGSAVAMGGRLGFLGGISDQTREKIQQAGFQIQDFAVQVGAGTSATQAFAQQFPQLAGAFGPVGVVIGTLAAVGLPLLGAAFSAASEDAKKLTEQMEQQKVVSDALTEAAQRLRLEREMASSGAQFTEEQKALNEIIALTEDRKRLENELYYLQLQDAEGASEVAAEKWRQLTAQKQIIDARLKVLNAQLRELENERRLTSASENARKLAEMYRAVQDAIAKADLSGPWRNVLGSIQSAIGKAREYAAAMRQAKLGMTTGNADWTKNSLGFTLPGEELLNLPDGSGDNDGGGGGGGQNPVEAQLEALRQQMMTEEQIEMESFAKRQEMLKAALDQKLLTQKEYAALMEQAQQSHADKMAEIDVWRYGTTLDKAQAFFGGMASALQGGNEKMLAISKKFAAAEALINAWKGFSDVLADKSLPFWAKIPSALKVLAAGMGAVNAIKGGGGSASGSGRSVAAAGGGAAPQQPVQTMNLHFTNDPWGIAERTARQIAGQVNAAARNGMVIQTNVVTG